MTIGIMRPKYFCIQFPRDCCERKLSLARHLQYEKALMDFRLCFDHSAATWQSNRPLNLQMQFALILSLAQFLSSPVDAAWRLNCQAAAACHT
jgi:hypothetical protein